MSFLKVLNYAQALIVERVNEGDVVIDATCGNGNDTVFLAELVGAKGKVYAFDIQEQALVNTKERLAQLNQATNLGYTAANVQYIRAGHEELNQWVDEPVSAVMFNLGYLPGADKAITTKPENTISALIATFDLLTINGIVTLILYTEHDSGHEATMVEEFLKTLDQKSFQVIKYGFMNQINYPPYLIAIEKLR